jgi:cobalt-zinc-cadmium efflux system membrane fusion protein
MQNKKILFSLVFIFSILIWYSCGNQITQDNTVNKKFCIPDSLLKNVTFDTLHSEPVKSELTLSGKIAFNEDKVSRIFPLAGGHVTDVIVSLGDYVEKGKILAKIESSDMANFYNEFKSSQAEVEIAGKNLEVTGNMRSSGVSSEKDFIVAQNEYKKALAEFKKIREVLKIYGSSVTSNDSTGSGYVIKAPISGFVVEKNVTVGMDLRPDAADNLFTISDLKDLFAIANVYETDISKIRIGSEATVFTLSYPDKKLTGRVERISNILDPETKAMTVKVRLDNKDFTLKPGMFAHISINLPGEKRMLAVKSGAIIFDDEKSYVLRYKGKCDIKIERVNILNSNNDMNFVVSDSLKEGDYLIERNGLYIFTALKSL